MKKHFFTLKDRLFKYVFINFLLVVCLAPLYSNTSRASEVRNFDVKERRYGSVTVPVELSFPDNTFQKPYPLIITQHGSERDGRDFVDGDGRTDEFSKRLISMATKKGFAVAAIDAFHGKSLSPTDKTRFPFAQFYADQIKNQLALDDRIDKNAIFYTGFSYGAGTVLNSVAISMGMFSPSWKAIAAAEPSCNAFPEPKRVNYPVLIIKGGESHYEPRPCEIFAELFAQEGTELSVKIFPHSNHYFSHHGKIVDGHAFNGCGDNPVIIRRHGKSTFLNGNPAPISEIRSKCFTNKGGSGKGRENLDNAINLVINFFLKNK